jgi:hypothetical protein
MMDKTYHKKGLTGFGWLLVAGGAAFLLSSKDRRERALSFVRGLGGRLSPSESSATPA